MKTKVSAFEIVRQPTCYMVWAVRGSGWSRGENLRARAHHNISSFSLERVARLLHKADFMRVTVLCESLGVEGYFSDKSKL